MAVLETIVIAVGGSLATYLAKEVLPADWQDVAAKALISVGVKQAHAWQKREPDPTAEAIGQRLAERYRHSSLDEGEKNSALIEVICTLETADTTVDSLMQLDLDAEQLRRALIDARSDAVAQLLADGEAHYEQMLRDASEGLMAVAHRVERFSNAWARAQLGGQRRMLDNQAEMLDLLHALGPKLASWLAGPSEQTRYFEEQVYRPAVVRKLNCLEPFGIEEGDRLGDHLKLTDSFVTPDLRSTFWKTEDRRTGEVGVDLYFQTVRLSSEAAPPHPIIQRAGRVNHQEQRMSVVQVLAQVERLMVVGAAGSGKSTFLQWLAICAAQQSFPEALDEWNHLVPFFIRLRDHQGEGCPKPEHFVDRITTMGSGEMPDGWERAVLNGGRALLLFDGVDEIAKEDRELMLERLQELVELYPLCRYVVSSRPRVVEETRWPEWHEWLKQTHFAESRLPEMGPQQIEKFVVRWHYALEKGVFTN